MKKRGISLFAAVCVLFSFLLYRIVSLNYSLYSETDTGYSSKTLLIGQTRGNIYDVNMKKLVNNEEKLLCAARAGADSLLYIDSMRDKEKAEKLKKELSKGYPVLFEADEKISNDDMETFSVPQRYGEGSSLCHIIGYTDSEGNGVAGIEKAFNSFLKGASGSLSVTFPTDAKGKVLTGIVPTVSDDNFSDRSGVVLTIDSEIQKICEEAMKECDIESGTCVMLSASDAGIAACVSTPSFSRDDIASAIKSENSPLLNKAFSAYAVGSVFKPVIGCAALENGVKPETDFNCTGEADIGGIKYGCNNRTAHGNMDMKSALEVSCNTYFINLTKDMKPSAVCDFCNNMGFGSGSDFCEEMSSEKGSFPEESELESKGAKANISFGQGSLTATPVQLAAAYLAIADGGFYRYPYLIRGTVDAYGKITKGQQKPQSKVISEKTSETMKNYLISVVENGNAYRAQCSLCTVAGKTGTAQSGIFDKEGKEILRTWFVGFFPANNPLFSVAVLSENGKSGAQDCAPVFSLIAERTMNLLIHRSNN